MDLGKTFTSATALSLVLSAGAFAEEITVATVNRWENGHAKPSKLARRAIERLVQYRTEGSAQAV